MTNLPGVGVGPGVFPVLMVGVGVGGIGVFAGIRVDVGEGVKTCGVSTPGVLSAGEWDMFSIKPHSIESSNVLTSPSSLKSAKVRK